MIVQIDTEGDIDDVLLEIWQAWERASHKATKLGQDYRNLSGREYQQAQHDAAFLYALHQALSPLKEATT